METTTVQVRKEQAEELKSIARKNGNCKTVIGRLLESYNKTTTNSVDADAIVETLLQEIQATTIINVEDARLIGQNVDKTVAPYAEDIEGYIKDLETNIPRKTAEELR